MRQGDFSELLDPNNPYIARTIADPADPTQRLKIPVYVKDPQSAAASQCGQVLNPGISPPYLIQLDVSRKRHSIGPSEPRRNRHPEYVAGPYWIRGCGNWFAAKRHTFDQRKDTFAVDVNPSEKHHSVCALLTITISSTNHWMETPTARQVL